MKEREHAAADTRRPTSARQIAARVRQHIRRGSPCERCQQPVRAIVSGHLLCATCADQRASRRAAASLRFGPITTTREEAMRLAAERAKKS